MSISASMHGHDDSRMRRVSGWAGLSGTAGSDDPVLPPLPAAPHERGHGPRHTTGIAVSELVLRDDTGSFSATGAVVTSGGRVRRHAAPLSLRRGVAATRVTTAAVLVGGTALGVVGATLGPFSPPVDDSPGVGPDGTPAGVAPVPGAPGIAGLLGEPVLANPQSIAFSTVAESLGLPAGALGGALAGIATPAGSPALVNATSLPGAAAVTAPAPGTGVTTPGTGASGGTPVVPPPAQPGPGAGGGGGAGTVGGTVGGVVGGIGGIVGRRGIGAGAVGGIGDLRRRRGRRHRELRSAAPSVAS